MRFTFEREERLKSKKIIGRLFNKEGKSFAIYPLRIIWIETPLETSYPVQIGVVVPKRHFKKAVQRNKIKRRILESYRLNKHSMHKILQTKEKQCAMMIVYTGREEMPYEVLNHKMQILIRKLNKRFR